MKPITIKGIQLTAYGHECLLNDIKKDFITLARAIGTPDKKGGFICPSCKSGTGTDGTGISYSPEGVFTCWAGSCINGDILNFIKLHGKGNTYIEQLETAIDILGVNLSRYEQKGAERMMQTQRNTPPTIEKVEATPEADYTEQYKVWAENLKNSTEAKAYLAARGIIFEDLPEMNPPLGFCSNWRSPKSVAEGKNPPPTKRLIIPTGKGHYLARDITGSVDKDYSKMHTGQKEPFGLSVLNTATPGEYIFITEGEIDALSFISKGYKAIALGGTTGAKALAEKIAGTPFTYIVAGDNDAPGKKATATLLDATKGNAKVYDMTAVICEGAKDPNEVLADNEEVFEKRAKLATTYIKKPNNARAFLETKFDKEAIRFQDAAGRLTGIKTLDQRQGSLYSGVYVLFAISSLGKTTLAHQIADYMACSGQEVLYFSLEMSTHEMICKSLNREIHKNNPFSKATALKIRRGLNNEEVKAAKAIYLSTTADRMNIIEGDFNYSSEDISHEIKAHIERTGERPVVFIDYLQLLKPIQDKRQTTKEVMDTAITDLKQIAREYNITIIAVSSVNRANYTTEVSFEAIKESGSIEYTADVVWGLQLAAVHEIPTTKEGKVKITEARAIIKQAKIENPRKIELVCLKNRYGVSSYNVDLLYYPAQDTIIDAEIATGKNFTSQAE